jgi:arabinose-5-phosphate isomerase
LNSDNIKKLARAVLDIEAKAVHALKSRINADFSRACEIMLACSGRIVVLGMGKSGHIGGKIAATLASTGTPAFFVHPGEASHGDLGMITKHDVVLALSNSGETREIITLLPIIKRLGVPMITLTGDSASTLAQAATINIDVSVAEEACPLGLAPTSSSTAALAMGDALAISLLETRGFTAEDFALSHPGGSLGRKLLLRIDDIMHRGQAVPKIGPDANLGQALVEMTAKSLGMTAIVDAQDKVLGLFTDGDLRRALDQGSDVHHTLISAIMTANPICSPCGILAAEALNTMQAKKINGLLVVDENNALIGAVNMQDFLRAGVV